MSEFDLFRGSGWWYSDLPERLSGVGTFRNGLVENRVARPTYQLSKFQSLVPTWRPNIQTSIWTETGALVLNSVQSKPQNRSAGRTVSNVFPRCSKPARGGQPVRLWAPYFVSRGRSMPEGYDPEAESPLARRSPFRSGGSGPLVLEVVATRLQESYGPWWKSRKTTEFHNFDASADAGGA